MYAHAQAPCRIGIAGGGTDLPAWTRERVGHCLSLAIDVHTHAVAIERPDGSVVASYRHLDVARAATEIANGLIRESALMHGFEDSFEIHTLSEVSSQGSGLGVSSSIAVALAATFSRLLWLKRGEVAEPKWRDGGEIAFRQQIAADAWTVEIDRLRRPIGRQDHMAAAHGGLRLYSFSGSGADIDKTFSTEDATWVASILAVVKLPEGHDSRTILAAVKSPEQLQAANDAVEEAVLAIAQRDRGRLGRALQLGQQSKRKIAGATTSDTEAVVRNIEAVTGVHGCKVAGAGGGGHVVVALEPEAIAAVENATRLPVQRVRPDLIGVRCDGWR